MTAAPKYAVPEDLTLLFDRTGIQITGHREIDYATQYRLSRGSETANLNVYRTRKVSVDGKGSELKSLLESWRLAHSNTGRRTARRAPEETTNPAKSAANITPRLGTDEAGKGEYFGPLVVAGVRIMNEDQERELREAGVRDSKELSRAQARKISARIKEIAGPENLRIVSLKPKEYAKRWTSAGSNVNRLLGELNAEIIGELKAEVQLIVADKFAERARLYIAPAIPEGVDLEVRARAENDAAVAAASILARARYLEDMDLLSGQIGFELPRGSTHVLEAARRVYRERGWGGLAEVAKVHFSITKQVIGETESKTRGGGKSDRSSQ